MAAVLLLEDALPFERGCWSLRFKLSQLLRCTQQGLGGVELQRYLTSLFPEQVARCWQTELLHPLYRC